MHSTGKFVRANFMSIISHETIYNVALVSSSNISTSFPFNRANFKAALTSAELIQVQYKRRVYRKCPISVSPSLPAIRSQVSGINIFSNGPKVKETKLFMSMP